MVKRRHISAKLREDLREYLELRAKQENRSMSNMLERIIEKDKQNGRVQ